MVRGENNDSTSGGPLRKRGWLRDQALVWSIKKIEVSPSDAERIANSSEMHPEIEQALNRLKGEVYKELYKVFFLGVTGSWPVVKFHILCDGRYIDLLTFYRLLPGGELSAQLELMREFAEDVVRRLDVEYDPDWVKQVLPATAPAAETSAPAANTAAVAKPTAAAHAQSPPGQPEVPPPNKLDEQAPSMSEAPERATKKTPAANASTSKTETASTPPTASRGPVNVGWVDPTIAYAFTKQLSSRRRPIRQALPSKPAPEPPEPLAREPATRMSMPEPTSPVGSELTPPTAPVSSAPEVESGAPLPTTLPDESTSDQVESDAPDNSERPPSDARVKAFVTEYIENAKASGETPSKRGLWEIARTGLPGATRNRLHGEYEMQTQTLPPGRPRKDRE